MLDQALQAVPRVRRTDPGTSHEAAFRAGEFAATHQHQILAVLQASEHPLGAEQIGDALGMPAYAVRKRLAELFHVGCIVLASADRKTRAGRSERMWEAV